MITERPANGNFAAMAERHAAERPDKLALVVPKAWDATGITEADRLTFAQVWQRVQQFMAGLEANDIGPGDRVLLAFPLCADLYCLALALFARGATAILVDASMGRKKVKRAVASANVKAVVSVNALLKYRWMIGAIRRIPLKFSLDKAGWGVRAIDQLAIAEPDPSLSPITRSTDDEALITYTSGSTGDPKGADRNHGLLIEQVMTFPQLVELDEDYIAFPAFPVVALAGVSLGVTTILPPMNFAAPGEVDPAPVVSEMLKWELANVTGPPSYMRRLCEYIIANEIYVGPRQLGAGGAPVQRDLCRLMAKAFPDTECFVIYGSTEAEPMAHIQVDELLTKQERAYPAGHVAPVATVALVDLTDVDADLTESGIEPHRVAAGEIGEVVVSGSHVNKRYVDNEAATRENKLFEVDGTVWHRTGDLAYQDGDGLLWLVGRRNYMVDTGDQVVHPFVVEVALDMLPELRRAALVANKVYPQGIIAVQPMDPAADRDELVTKVLLVVGELGLGKVPIQVIDDMPVDNRHNSKVDRVSLRRLLK